MSVLVGSLSVDIVNGTATFKLDDAKSELDSFGKKVQDTQGQVDYSMGEARHSVMLLGEEFGVHMPRALTSFIAGLGPIGPALSAAFPFLAIAVGATLLIEHFAKMGEAAEKLKQSQEAAGLTIQEVYNSLGDKLLEVGMKADELAGNHFAALQTKLELIDHQSMKELMHEFDLLAKASDAVFASLETSWYSFDAGSKEAKKELAEFKIQYASLGAQHKGVEAANLLSDAYANAKKKLDELNYANRFGEAMNEKEIASTKELMEAYDRLTRGQDLSQQITKGEQNNATTIENLRAESREVIKLARDHGEFAKARKKAAAEAEKQEEEALNFLQTMDKELLDRAAKQQAENLKVAQSFDKITEGQIKANAAGGKETVNSQEHLGIISAIEAARQIHAIDETELEDYKKFLKHKIDALRDYLVQKQAQAQAAKGTNREDETTQAAATAQIALNAAIAQGVSEQQKMTSAVQQSDTAASKLQSSWGSYFAKMKTETQDLSLAIRQNLQGSIDQFTKSFGDSMAKSIVENKSLTQAVRQEAGHMLESMISMLVQWLERWIMTHTLMKVFDHTSLAEQLTAGKLAASQLAGANAVASYSLAPFPIDMGAPAFGASMAAAALAFEKGGIVPGNEGTGVPIMAHAQEMVLPAPIAQGLKGAIEGGSFNGGGDMHMHANFSPVIHALDSEGVDKVLTKHGAKFAQHITQHLRKMNR